MNRVTLEDGNLTCQVSLAGQQSKEASDLGERIRESLAEENTAILVLNGMPSKNFQPLWEEAVKPYQSEMDVSIWLYKNRSSAPQSKRAQINIGDYPRLMRSPPSDGFYYLALLNRDKEISSLSKEIQETLDSGSPVDLPLEGIDSENIQAVYEQAIQPYLKSSEFSILMILKKAKEN